MGPSQLTEILKAFDKIEMKFRSTDLYIGYPIEADVTFSIEAKPAVYRFVLS